MIFGHGCKATNNVRIYCNYMLFEMFTFLYLTLGKEEEENKVVKR
jgi:hypothetical protein